MTKPLIAVSGKGGTGKTTVSALLVRRFVASGMRPVLAVDADPNSCLGELLGLEVEGTLADLREETRNKAADGSGTRISELDLGLNQIISEGVGLDLLTMGRPEGAGCYCYINALLREWLRKARGNYAVTVIDNEAGMEHVSRLIAGSIDTLVVVAEPTVPAARAARRINELAGKLPMQVARRLLVWNKVTDPDELDAFGEIAGVEAFDSVASLAYSEILENVHRLGAQVKIENIEVPGLDEIARIAGQPGFSPGASV